MQKSNTSQRNHQTGLISGVHTNTLILLGFLAIIAASITGIKVARLFSPSANETNLTTPAPSSAPKTYTSTRCGVSFAVAANFTLTEASDAATLVDEKTQEKIEFACVRSFPDRPLLPPDRIEEATIAGQLATIYHDNSAATKKPVDLIIFTHPANKLEIILLGFGEEFKKILSSLKIER